MKTERIEPPASLTAPRVLPGPPRVPEGDLENQDVIEWYEQWIRDLQKAFLASEEDKRAVRKWVESGESANDE